MDKNHIVHEIKRTAEENGGVPLGHARFERETGIKFSDWYGKYWARWGDAVAEAGYPPNKFNQAYEDEFVILKLINLIQELGKYPTAGELRLKVRQDKTYPAHTVFDRLGKKNDRIKKIIEYCRDKSEFSEVSAICQKAYKPEKERAATSSGNDDFPIGFVNL